MGRGRRKSEPQPKVEELGAAEVKIEGTTGAFGLQEAPVFYPSEEEFENPLRYIAQIRPQAEIYGICRIVPPSTWDPPFGFDTEKFTFPTKLQAIHHLQERPAACDADTFKLEYSRFLIKQGETLERWPCLEDGEEVDLCKLFNAVKRHGGHEKVATENRWGEVVRMVAAGASRAASSPSSMAVSLRQLYEKHLSTFEVYQTKVGAGKRWRAKNKQESSTEKAANKSKRGGRKRVSGSDFDVSLDVKKEESAENDLCEVLRPATLLVDARPLSKRFGRKKQSGAEADLDVSGENKKLDTSTEQDVVDSSRSPGDVEGRPQSNPAAPRKRRKTDEKFAVPEGLGRTDQMCEQCHSGAHEQLMLLCDRCDRGWHLYCLSPPLSTVPVGNWYCLECLSSESESFGFGQGQEYSFDSFRRMADRFKRKWFGARPSNYADLEKEFWRVVERGTAPVDVLYGSDLDTGVYGSGFPRVTDPIPAWANADAWEAGAKNPWNVNNFPKLEGSMLSLVHDNIPGVMVPWLYIGMLFSSFCWHYEDHCFYSVNYLHCGEPKSWYSVPGSAAEEFEKVMRSTFPDLFEAQPDLLFQLVTMLNPTVLRDNGVPVCMTVQEPRNFVITFPRSYHGGFNHGFNCAEAVNFAPSDWLPFGGFGVDRYRLYHKAAVLSHDELLCVVAKNEKVCGRSPWLQQELARIITKERNQREYLWSLGMVKSSRMTPSPYQDRIGAEEDAECIICRYYLHLSAVICQCRPGKAVCLQHARQLCECSADQQSLLYRFTLAELDDLIGNEDQSLEDTKVGDLAAAPSTNKRRLRRGQNGASSLTSSLVKKVKGRPYRHAELAETWLAQARAAGKSHLRSPVLEDLLTQVQQFLWGGHEMDQVRDMVDKLNSAYKWVQDVAACSAALERHGNGSNGKAVKVPFTSVLTLVTVDPVPWVEPHVQTLKALFEPARRLEQQIEESLMSSFPLEIRVLQALQQEASHSPFELPGLQRLKDLLSSAQVWSEQVRKLISLCPKMLRNRSRTDQADLRQLEALHEEGSKLPVIIGEWNFLDSTLRVVKEWQKGALQLLGARCSMQELEEILRSSENLAVHPPEVDILEGRLQQAQDWIQSAGEALRQADQGMDFAVLIKKLADLLQRGKCLQVDGLTEVGLLEERLKKVNWMHNASQTMLDHPTINCLQDLVVEAKRLQLDDQQLVFQIGATLRDASAWEMNAEHLFSSGGSLEAFTHLASAAEDIHAKLPGLNGVKKAISEANLWLDQAQVFFQSSSSLAGQDGTSQPDLCTLQALVVHSRNLAISLHEGKLLCTAVAAAESWIFNARLLETSVLVAERCSLEAKQTEQNFPKQDDCDTTMRLQRDVVKLQSTVDEGLALCVRIAEIGVLQGLCLATRWSLKARKLLECTSTVKEVESHLEEVTFSTPSVLPELTLLQGMLDKAKAWRQAAASFLPGFGTKGCRTEEQLELLISDAKLLPLSVSSEAGCLEDMLASHRAWKKKVQLALSGTTSLTWSELVKLQEAGEADMVYTNEEQLLNREVVEVRSWLVSCHEAFSRQPAYLGATLEVLLLKMGSSVNSAIQYLEIDDMQMKQEPSCVCQKVFDKSDSSLLQCEACEYWYHHLCVGVAQAHTRLQKHFVCPYCSAIASGGMSLNRELCPKIYATQRTHLGLLENLLLSGQMLRCRIKEKELLEGVINMVHFWQRRFKLMIEPVLVCEKRHGVLNFHRLLVAAQKSVEAMEVQDEESGVLQRALGINAWREKVFWLLNEESSKPLPRVLTRTLKEGLAIPVDGQDFVLEELKRVEACTALWATRAKQVIGDRGQMALVDVQALILEGEEMPVALTKELSALRERSLLYCICQKPYDEDRAMIACDRCGEWYHFSCINLPEPDSSDEDGDDAIQQECELSGDFVCPQCKDLGRDRGHPVTTSSSEMSPYRDQKSQDEANINKVVEGTPFTPLNGFRRGKRSSRSSNKARGEFRNKWQSPLFAPGKLLWHTQRRSKQHEQSDDSVTASGRPCRRTAGRHSRFESFVLLMRSR